MYGGTDAYQEFCSILEYRMRLNLLPYDPPLVKELVNTCLVHLNRFSDTVVIRAEEPGNDSSPSVLILTDRE